MGGITVSESTRVLVVGASARAAVHSLKRAGFAGAAVDLFGDRDVKRLAPTATCPLEDYPNRLTEFAAEFPSCPVMYTGGLENHPNIVAELSRGRPLWGNPPEVLEQVRDPFLMYDLLHRDFRCPALINRAQPAPANGLWLRKPLRSSGGLGIRFASANEAASSSHYIQEYIKGPSFSVLLVNGMMLGVTEQLIGESWLQARPFAYCGNVGPITTSPHVEAYLRRIGRLLADATGIRGLWGLDFILRDDVVYPLEVNPRYTAGAEVLELGDRVASLSLHVACFSAAGETEATTSHDVSDYEKRTVGKAIYYAPERLVFPAHGPWDEDLASPFDPWRVPGYADIPEPGAPIERGMPVLTVFATASSAHECRIRLQLRARELDRLTR